MDTKYLEAFVATYQEGQFTRAAERLGVAQPVVSQRIKQLEKEYGAQLLRRDMRPIGLTKEGLAILPFAMKILEAEELSRRAIEVGEPELVGKVSLGYAGASVNPFLPRLVQFTKNMAPGVQIQFKPMIYAMAAQKLILDEEIDIAFSRSPKIDSAINERVIEYEALVAAVSSSHRLAKRTRLSVKDLRDEPWVMFPENSGSKLHETGIFLANEAGFAPRIEQTAPDSYSLLGMVAAGVGVTITLSSVARTNVPGVHFIRLGDPITYLTATIIHKKHPTSIVQAVLKAAEKAIPTPAAPNGRILG